MCSLRILSLLALAIVGCAATPSFVLFEDSQAEQWTAETKPLAPEQQQQEAGVVPVGEGEGGDAGAGGGAGADEGGGAGAGAGGNGNPGGNGNGNPGGNGNGNPGGNGNGNDGGKKDKDKGKD